VGGCRRSSDSQSVGYVCVRAGGISWLEQPEEILTAVATMPYPREVTSAHLKHLKLYR